MNIRMQSLVKDSNPAETAVGVPKRVNAKMRSSIMDCQQTAKGRANGPVETSCFKNCLGCIYILVEIQCFIGRQKLFDI